MSKYIDLTFKPMVGFIVAVASIVFSVNMVFIYMLDNFLLFIIAVCGYNCYFRYRKAERKGELITCVIYIKRIGMGAIDRPEKIYLDEAIEIKGIKITHTKEGLLYLIDHYSHLIALNIKARTTQGEEHMKWLIANWKQHLSLYENGQPR